MKRVTVSITMSDAAGYVSPYDAAKIKSAMIEAAADRARDLGCDIVNVDAKSANNVKNRAPSE